MRTEETYFVQAVEREIPCQCGDRCIAKPPPSTLTQVGVRQAPPPPMHETPDQHASCVMRYVAEFVTERVRELRAKRGGPLPPNVYMLFADNMNPAIYKDAVRTYRLNFADSTTELEQLIISNFADVCGQAVRRASVST